VNVDVVMHSVYRDTTVW